MSLAMIDLASYLAAWTIRSVDVDIDGHDEKTEECES